MLINKSAMKKFILAKWAQKRPGHKITRVSANIIAHYEARLEAMIVADIMIHPSKGKTFSL